LVPKKAKDFIKPTIEETGYSEELVNSLIDFYWSKVRKDMSDLVHPNILVPNLGTFKIKHWKLDETKEHYQKILDRIEGKFSKYKMYKAINDKVERIDNLKVLMEKDKERLDKIKLKKNESINNNMEEQVSDMGGIQEQNIQEQQSRETVQGENADM
jgi:hypothetical protein